LVNAAKQAFATISWYEALLGGNRTNASTYSPSGGGGGGCWTLQASYVAAHVVASDRPRLTEKGKRRAVSGCFTGGRGVLCDGK
jgi:hypothetical protein